MKLLKLQKIFAISYILCINVLLSVLISIYNKYWYLFIGILGLSSSLNSINTLLIVGNKLMNSFDNMCQNKLLNDDTTENNYIFKYS